MSSNRRYDRLPSLPLTAEIESQVSRFKKPLRGALPPVVDLTGLCSPIQDQGQIGSCTAHAMSGMLEFLELQDFRHSVRMQPEEFKGPGLHHPSRLFIYYNERLMRGTENQDSGAAISDSVSAVVKYGFCDEPLWPYDPPKLLIRPEQAAYQQAKFHHCSTVRRLDVNDLQSCLASGLPFIFGINVFASFESRSVAMTGIVPMPVQNDMYLGGHAICCVGYDDNNEQFIFRNSWGDSWGLLGYGRLPYDYVLDADLSSDFWTILR